MAGVAIADGDLVVVRQQQAAENGEIVAAQIDLTGTAEATVKTLQRMGGHVWLMRHNPQTSRSRRMMPPSWGRWSPSGPGPGQAKPAPRLSLAAAQRMQSACGR